MLHAVALSSDEQTFWATLAQVNAAVLIALVVEIGVAAREKLPNFKTVGSFWPAVMRGIICIFYLAAAILTSQALLESLAVLGLNRVPAVSDSQPAINGTALAIGIVVFVPVIWYGSFVVRFSMRVGAVAAREYRQAQKLKRKRHGKTQT